MQIFILIAFVILILFNLLLLTL